MKLTQDQIQELYKFTRTHYVEHYDLQTELVDHLANGIEKLLKEDPNRTFKEATIIEFKKFGVFGFHHVIKERKKAMSKTYRLHILKFYKECFHLPKIFLVIGLSILVFGFLQLLNPEYKLTAITILFFIVGIYFMITAYKNRKAYGNRARLNKMWMLEEKIFSLGEGAQMGIFPMYIFNSLVGFDYVISNLYLEFFIGTFIVCYLILCYVMVFIIPIKAEKLLAETYPEYKFQQNL